MKAALIPPKGYYLTAAQSDYHLVLAQVTDPDYVSVYSNLPDDHFVIVDNGAAEGETVSHEELISAAHQYAANEVVMPDVMHDWRGTVQAMYTFVNKLGKGEDLPPDASLMFVAQGTSPDEVKQSIAKALEVAPFTIGIPRHLLDTFHDAYARGMILRHIEQTYGEIPVHLLGTNPNWASEIRVMHLHHPWVRGVDSSMPYNHTIRGFNLKQRMAPISRPEHYFTHKQFMDENLLSWNIRTYQEWARGIESAGS